MAEALNEFIAGYLGVVWELLVAYVPAPVYHGAADPKSTIMSLLGWLVLLVSLGGLAFRLLKMASDLRAHAAKIRTDLESQELHLRDIHHRQQQQRNRVGDVGDQSTVTQSNTITNIHNPPPPEGHLKVWVIGVATGLIANLLSKVLHIS